MKANIYTILAVIASFLFTVAIALFLHEKKRKKPEKGSIEYARKFRHKKPKPEPPDNSFLPDESYLDEYVLNLEKDASKEKIDPNTK